MRHEHICDNGKSASISFLGSVSSTAALRKMTDGTWSGQLSTGLIIDAFSTRCFWALSLPGNRGNYWALINTLSPKTCFFQVPADK